MIICDNVGMHLSYLFGFGFTRTSARLAGLLASTIIPGPNCQYIHSWVVCREHYVSIFDFEAVPAVLLTASCSLLCIFTFRLV